MISKLYDLGPIRNIQIHGESSWLLIGKDANLIGRPEDIAPYLEFNSRRSRKCIAGLKGHLWDAEFKRRKEGKK